MWYPGPLSGHRCVLRGRYFDDPKVEEYLEGRKEAKLHRQWNRCDAHLVANCKLRPDDSNGIAIDSGKLELSRSPFLGI